MSCQGRRANEATNAAAHVDGTMHDENRKETRQRKEQPTSENKTRRVNKQKKKQICCLYAG